MSNPSPERGAIRRVVCAVREAQDTHNVMAVMLSANTDAALSELAALEADRERFQQAAFDADQARRDEAVWRGLAEDQVADLRAQLTAQREDSNAFVAAIRERVRIYDLNGEHPAGGTTDAENTQPTAADIVDRAFRLNGK